MVNDFSGETPESNIEKVYKSVKKLENKKWEYEIYEHIPENQHDGRYRSLELRYAKPEDCKNLALLYKESFPSYPYKQLHTEEYHLEGVDDMDTIRVVELLGGELIGAGALGLIPPCLLGELKQAVVKPKYRGRGFINKLVHVRIDIAKQIGLEMIDTHARTREPGIQKALLNYGFKPICIIPGIYIVYHPKGPVRENMIYMTKYLNGGEKRIDTKDSIIRGVLKELELFKWDEDLSTSGFDFCHP